MRLRRAACAALTLASVGCTFEPGGGYASVQSARLDIHFDAGAARDLGNSVFLTDQGFAVDLKRFEFTADTLSLEELVTTGSSASSSTFDPADPPPGYSLCHGGHCHADDGRLVSYAEIEAELAGSSARLVPVVSFTLPGNIDALSASTIDLPRPDPSPELPRSHLKTGALRLTTFELEALVTSPESTSTHSLKVKLSSLPPWTQGLDLVIDRDGPESLRVEALLALDGTLLDGLDLSGPPTTANADAITSPSDPRATQVIENLAAMTFSLSL